MRRYPTDKGPFTIGLYYEPNEIEDICSNALAETGYLPFAPQPIKIDRFIEKKFNLKQIICEPLEPGCLGYTQFSPAGVEQVYIAPYDEDSPLWLQEHRRLNATLAHEAGHGLLHSELYLGGFVRTVSSNEHTNVTPDRILCPESSFRKSRRRYSGEWWEVQANLAIGALLLPTELFHKFMDPYLKQTGTRELDELPKEVQDSAIKQAAAVFDVNEEVVRIRIKELSEVPF